MREILFRGKNVYIGEFVHGFYITMHGKSYIINYDYSPAVVQVTPETVGQFTGLVDKNGTKIFEGDIVKVFNKPYSAKETIVIWGVKSHGWSLKCEVIKDSIHDPKIKYYGLGSSKNIEIIGNIHEYSNE